MRTLTRTDMSIARHVSLPYANTFGPLYLQLGVDTLNMLSGPQTWVSMSASVVTMVATLRALGLL